MNTALKATVSRVISAPIDQVFKAWVEPEQMKQWYGPEDMYTPEAESDPRTGGKYSVVMAWKENGVEKRSTKSGEYLEFDEPNRLVFTWGDAASVVEVDFKTVEDDKTEVTLTHTGFENQQSCEGHSKGWDSTLSKLAKHVN